MPASDRLPELLRQRALVAEQLAWLDREIAAAGGPPAAAPAAGQEPLEAAPANSGSVAAPARATSPAGLGSTPDPAAEEIIAQYRVAPDALKTDVRQGCLLYFGGALALIALGVIALYFVFQRTR